MCVSWGGGGWIPQKSRGEKYLYMKERENSSSRFRISVKEMDGEQTEEGMSTGKITKRQSVQ